MKILRFEKLIKRHKNRIFSQAIYILKDKNDAEDVTQEVILRIWQNMDRYNQTAETAWIMRVTYNLCIDFYRRKKVLRFADSLEESDGAEMRSNLMSREADPSQMAENADVQGKLLWAIEKLPDLERRITILREIEDKSYQEIARILDMPINSVKVYLHRGRIKLRKLLSPYLDVKKLEVAP